MPRTASGATTVRVQLETIHRELACDQAGLDRIAVALYDPATGGLRTFLHSTRGRAPFALYEISLAEVPSLVELAESGSDRVLDDLDVLAASPSAHSRLLLAHGFKSSYTRPFFEHDHLSGFVFFDSLRPAYFSTVPRCRRAAFAELVALRVAAALAPVRLLRAAVDVAREVTRLRDEETGTHLERMARYARLIARDVAGREGRDDEFVEYVHLFAPLHDVGKIGVPDAVLHKPGRLAGEELGVMRGHVERGLELVALLARAFGLRAEEHFELLRNIVAGHHECVDGSGYPAGLRGGEIPLEARVVAVADVFDALTSARPYKPAWSNDEAFAWLAERAGRAFDAECVHALATRRVEVEAIQRQFREPVSSGAFDLLEV
jgi:HD-GYP domain-containing protein (c-di-GMP phosphodiesterase class II)